MTKSTTSVVSRNTKEQLVPRRRRPRHGFGDTRTRCWIRANGRILRFINVTDWRPCADGNPPREFLKRLTHRRWPRGHHMYRGKYTPAHAAWYLRFTPGQWYQITDDIHPFGARKEN